MVRKILLNPLRNGKLKEKSEQLKNQFKKSQDLRLIEHHTIMDAFEMIYFETLIDLHYLDQYILPKLSDDKEDSVKKKLKSLFQAEDVSSKSLDDLSNLLFDGNVLFLFSDSFLSIQAGSLPMRQPEESAIESSIRGPKDGFVEDIKTNISLIRRRLNTSSLCLEKYTIGKRSRTKVVLMYIDDLIDQRVLDEIHKRLDKVELDILTSIHELEAYVRDRPYSIFPSTDYTGRPDFIVQALNQGRFALIVDGNPTVSYAPVNILLQIKSPEDNYISYAYVSIERIIRVIGLIISAFLPGAWIAFSAYNIEQVPYLLVATITISRFGLPISSPLEMFIVLFLFELFNEAGVRLPRAIGQTVAVLGGLIVGDAAIRAGLTSPTMLVVCDRRKGRLRARRQIEQLEGACRRRRSGFTLRSLTTAAPATTTGSAVGAARGRRRRDEVAGPARVVGERPAVAARNLVHGGGIERLHVERAVAVVRRHGVEHPFAVARNRRAGDALEARVVVERDRFGRTVGGRDRARGVRAGRRGLSLQQERREGKDTRADYDQMSDVGRSSHGLAPVAAA